jgi:hypothetical protein
MVVASNAKNGRDRERCLDQNPPINALSSQLSQPANACASSDARSHRSKSLSGIRNS